MLACQLLRKDVTFCFCSGAKHVSCPTDHDGSVLMDVSVETSEQLQADHMEVVPSESMEVPQPAASPSLPEKRLYKSRSEPNACTGNSFWGWDHTVLIA